jgi:hypothetical protein
LAEGDGVGLESLEIQVGDPGRMLEIEAAPDAEEHQDPMKGDSAKGVRGAGHREPKEASGQNRRDGFQIIFKWSGDSSIVIFPQFHRTMGNKP